MSAAYRVHQFLRAATSWASSEMHGDPLAGQVLNPMAMQLFQRMPRYDQRHAFAVMNTLREWGYSDPDLLTAALLHDVGKTAKQPGRLRLWHRVAVVLLRALQPGLLERLGELPSESFAPPDAIGSHGQRRGRFQWNCESWRVPFFVQKHHAAISAELAREAGCSAESVELILHHEDNVTTLANGTSWVPASVKDRRSKRTVPVANPEDFGCTCPHWGGVKDAALLTALQQADNLN